MKVNLTQLADIAGLTRKTIKKHLDLGKVEPIDRKGRVNLYDSTAVLKCIPPESLGNMNSRTLNDENIRLRKSQAARSETAHQKELGNLLDVDDVRAQWLNIVGVVRRRILLVPNSCAPLVAGESDVRACTMIVNDAVRRALTALSEEGADELGRLDEQAKDVE